MAVPGTLHGGYLLPSKFRSLPPKIHNRQKPPPRPPIYISTDPTEVNPTHLRDLYYSCNHSCHRFPNFLPNGKVEPLDVNKLAIALAHSTFVVSVFSKPAHVSESSSSEVLNSPVIGGDWLRRVMPVTPFNGRLVGFGRAVSDFGLTASIYDVMHTSIEMIKNVCMKWIEYSQCHSHERQFVCRMLINRGIYDVAAVCTDEERGFFKACGFGDDQLESTTMMYTRSVSDPSSLENNQTVKLAARGLRRTSALWKLQWFAVGWINPDEKYCTRIDSSGNANPVWRTKFSALIDSSDPTFSDLALNVEVYSREPIFLRERLQGTTTVVLKEFLDKYSKNSEVSKPVEEVGSFQLRRRNSNKPQGFVDVSIRISEEKEESGSYLGDEEGFNLTDHKIGINLVRRPENHPNMNTPYAHQVPFSTSYPNSGVVGPSNPVSAGGATYQPPRTPPPGHGYQPHQTHGLPGWSYLSAGNSHQPPQTHPSPPPPPPPPPEHGYKPHQTHGPPGRSYISAGNSYQPPQTPPPPPSNVGYIPTYHPGASNLPPSYINMPPSSGAAAGRNNGAGFGMGLGAGALAAGAVIFGDDFMSGFELPGGLKDATLTISTDPPF